MIPLDPQSYRERLRAALDEDQAGGDVTCELLGLGETPAVEAAALVDEAVVVAGLEVAREAFLLTDAGVTFDASCRDGEAMPQGSRLFTVRGPARAVLSAERVAINFLQRLCGIATLTARFVRAVRPRGVTVLDTRKTTPLWRDLEKYAVRCGGAENHRRDLGAMVLVKENHIRAAGGVEAMAESIERGRGTPTAVEVEVDSIALLETLVRRDLLANGVDRVMLDNFTPEDVAVALDIIDAAAERTPGRRVEVEVSGGISLDNIQRYALPRVDYISVGALTHSAPASSISLEVIAK